MELWSGASFLFKTWEHLPRDNRVVGVLPLVLDGVQVRVAYPAVQYLYGNIVISSVPAQWQDIKHNFHATGPFCLSARSIWRFKSGKNCSVWAGATIVQSPELIFSHIRSRISQHKKRLFIFHAQPKIFHGHVCRPDYMGSKVPNSTSYPRFSLVQVFFFLKRAAHLCTNKEKGQQFLQHRPTHPWI